MSDPDLIGYVTLRVPIRLVEESESFEIPEVYTYLQPGDAELVSHDIPAAWHKHLREEIIECGGISPAEWTEKELAETTILSEHPLPIEPPMPTLDFNFLNRAGS